MEGLPRPPRRVSARSVEIPPGHHAYQVQAGDTLPGLALRFRTKAEQLRRINQLFDANLFVGQRLVVPDTPPPSPPRQQPDSERSGARAAAKVAAVTVLERARSFGVADVMSPKKRWVKKLPAVFCITGARHVSGELTVTPYFVVFEPNLSDELVRRDGLVPYQFNATTQSLVDVTVIDCEEDTGTDWVNVSTAPPTAAEKSEAGPPSTSEPSTAQAPELVHIVYKKEEPPAPSPTMSEPVYTKYLLLMFRASKMAMPREACFLLRESDLEEVHERLVSMIGKASEPPGLSGVPDANYVVPEGPPKVLSWEAEDEVVEQSLPGPSDSPGKPGAFFPNLGEDVSKVLEREDISFIVKELPARWKIRDWKLLYSTHKNGISMNTFLQRTLNKGPSIVVIRDSGGSRFGAFVSAAWKRSRSFYGTGETFVFRLSDTAGTSREAFHWSRLNTFFMIVDDRGIGIGGGSHYAIRLDNDFDDGSSGICETFASGCLASDDDFRCIVFECWGFCTHANDREDSASGASTPQERFGLSRALSRTLSRKLAVQMRADLNESSDSESDNGGDAASSDESDSPVEVRPFDC